jgi:uncharacterized membrane protein YgdD (TMEM256/DUF423 family)
MTTESRSSFLVFLGSLMAGTAVAAGAFGAHTLKGMLDGSMLAVFETAVRYQMYHALGLCIVAWAADRYPAQAWSTVGWCFVTGSVLFSGSLYAVSLGGSRWLGAFTPLGGLSLLGGWSLLAWQAWRARK